MATNHTVYQPYRQASSALAINTVRDVGPAGTTVISSRAATRRPPCEVGAVTGDGSGVVVPARLIALFIPLA
jgi:hypothetical protein